MKKIFKLKFFAVLTIIAMTVPMQIIAQAPPPPPPPRPGTQQWVTNLPTNVDIMIQTVVATNNINFGFWDLSGDSGWKDGAKLQLWAMEGVENIRADRRFRFEHMGDGWYVIRNNGYGVLDVSASNVNQNGQQIQVWQANNQNNQRFRFREAGNGEYVIQTQAGKYLHVDGGNHSNNGRAVVIHDGEGAQSTKWRIWTIENNARTVWTSQGGGLTIQLPPPPPPPPPPRPGRR